MTQPHESFLFYHGNCGNDQVRRALISVSIESALLGSGMEIYEKVIGLLEKKYNSSIPECYDHPEYLNKIFKTLHKNLRHHIIRSTKKGLDKFSYDKPISRFLDELNR